MSRALTTRNLYDQKFETFPFTGSWLQAMGEPTRQAVWLISGEEKNGKTQLALMLANYLSSYDTVLYVSAEEGTDKEFTDSCRRAGISAENRRLQYLRYLPITDLDEKLGRRKAPKIVFIDNMTVYDDEFRYGAFKRFIKRHGDKLLVFIAHEEEGRLFSAAARLCRKLAKVIMQAQGLKGIVSGRCPGGTLQINEEKAQLYWGT